MTSIRDNLRRVQDRIAAAAERSGRTASDVILVAASKFQPASSVLEAIAEGVAHIGENYVQEAAAKQLDIGEGTACWHLIGSLQSNKARAAVETFDLVETVDSMRLAEALNRRALEAGIVLEILLQVKLGSEPTKSGMMPGDVAEIADRTDELGGLSVRGLMGIAPAGENPRPYFRELNQIYLSMPESRRHLLSMGMSADFETAIEEGATMVRIGTALFGPRPFRTG